MGSLIERDLDYSNLVVLISQAADALSDSKSKSLNDGTRKELSQACEHLASQLRPPTKRIEDLTYAWTEISAIKIAIDMGIFDLIANSRSPEDGFTASEIATGLKGDAVLIERVLRSLMLSGLFSMTPTNRYKPDPSVREFASGGLMKDRIIVACDVVHPVGLKLPEFLAKSQYQSPENPYAGPFQFTYQTNDHCFTWLKNHPVQQSAFNGLMQSTIQNRPSRWFENFPAADRFQRFRESTAGHETLQLVDIGGGIGHDILGLTKHLPDLHANFILQEAPQVLDNMLAELHALPAEKQTMQPMPHDFFGAQPVIGAHVYFLGRVLHTWPNSQCRRILAHIKEAMTQDSVLLIHDRVFPDTTTASDLSRSDTAADFIMMVLHTAMERSEAQFADLLASAGLRLVAVWKPQGKKDSMERVLEAVRDEQ